MKITCQSFKCFLNYAIINSGKKITQYVQKTFVESAINVAIAILMGWHNILYDRY